MSKYAPYKICNTCNIKKEAILFYYSERFGLHYECKECSHIRERNRSARHHLKLAQDLDGEKWVDIFGYEGLYKISNFGRIKSLGTPYKPYIHLIQPSIQNGRFSFALRSKEGVSKKYLRYRLVAIHFIPNPYSKPCVNHINHNPSDDRIENIEWCTNQENIDHAWINDRFQVGEERYNSRFTEQEVLDIFNSNSLTNEELSKLYGVSKSTIQAIRTGRNWAYLTKKNPIEKEYASNYDKLNQLT